MKLYTSIFLLSGAFLILLYLECTTGSFRDVSYRRVARAKPDKRTSHKGTKHPRTLTTVKPGSSTTLKPGSSTTVKPGSSTTVKPGSSTTKKPGSSTTKKPGSSTTGKPGSSTTPVEGGSGEMPETTTRTPGGVVIVTHMPIPERDGFDIIGQHNGMVYYVSKEPKDKQGASAACDAIGDIRHNFALTTLTTQSEFQFVTSKLNQMHDGPFYIGIVIDNRDGKEIMIADSLSGRELYSLDDGNPEGIMSMRGKRETPLVSYVHRRVHRQSGKHKGKSAGGAGVPSTQAAPAAGGAEGGPTLITVMDTKYPWLATWAGNPAGGDCPSQCKPTTCTVNTTECTATTVECAVTHPKQCSVIEGGGQCATVCEKCDIASPECYVREPKCVVIKERKCTMSNPECQVNQGPCVVSRPECVSRQPPCNQTANTAPECQLPEKCKTHQAMECQDMDKPCAEGETPPCTYKQCKPLEICLTPEYCRYDTIVCPPVETFCPPEIVQCPPPSVTCPEPNITCTDPEVYCPPPTVVCTKPLVNCTAPRVSCPNVVTQCPNPEIDCPSPIVNCPEPTVFCEQPTIPCPLPPIKWKDCAVECEGKCNCVRLVKSGSEWRKEKCECEEVQHFICEGQGESGKPETPSPPGQPGQTPKPPRKG